MTVKDKVAWDEYFSHYPKTLLNRFKEFHKENPQVYSEFKSLAIKMRKSGRSKYSAQAIVYVIRFNNDLKSSGDVFKINNDFTSIYARLLMYNAPKMRGFFELRKERNLDIKSNEQKLRENKSVRL